MEPLKKINIHLSILCFFDKKFNVKVLQFLNQNFVRKSWLSLIGWQLIVGWETDSSNTEVLDFTTIPSTVIMFYSHLNYTRLNFGNGIFLM